jgi:hypothetical protein
MRRSRTPVAAALLLACGAALLPALAPPARAVPVDVRHYYDAEQIGSTADDTVTDVSDQQGVTAYAGTTAGDLAGGTNQGGVDSFVRMGTFDLAPHPGPFEEFLTRQLGGPGDDVANAVTTDGSTTVVGGVTDGDLVGTSAGGDDGWLWAVDRDGEDAWSEQIGGTGDDAVLDLASDADGNFWAAGRVGDQGFVRRYDSQGNLLWERTEGMAVTHLLVHQYYVPEQAYRLLMVVQAPSSTPGGDPGHRVVALDALTGEFGWASYQLGPASIDAFTMDTENPYVAGSIGTGSDEDSYVTAVVGHQPGRARTRVFKGLPGAEGADRATSLAWDGRQVLVTVHADGQPNDTLVSVGRGWSRPLPTGFTATSAAARGSDHFAGYHASYPLLLGGATDAALGGDNAGGTDAALARFVTWQPDAMATRKGAWPRIQGNNWYGPAYQRMVVPVRGITTSTARILAGNDGDLAQRLQIESCASHAGYRIRYRRHDRDQTVAVTQGTYLTDRVGVGDRDHVVIEVTPLRPTTGWTTCEFVVTSPTGGEHDRFKLIIRRRR